jgi:hypothetical protein|tara:strand:+ start:218 stop:919 length:702 start_codon:yes stop_codon:yes gene_type:complete
MSKIIFYSLVDNPFPIVKAKDHLPNWATEAREDFRTNKEKYATSAHVANCPGIYKILNEGFIVPLHYDVYIKWDGGDDFAWKSPVLDGSGILSVQAGTSEPCRPWSFKHIIKFNTAWRVFAPEGLKFLMLPLSYSENFDFDVCSGIWEPEINNAINLQLYWNAIGEAMITSGTPMAHLIPLTNKKLDVEVRTANERELEFEDKINKLREEANPIWKYKRSESINLYHKFNNES